MRGGREHGAPAPRAARRARARDGPRNPTPSATRQGRFVRPFSLAEGVGEDCGSALAARRACLAASPIAPRGRSHIRIGSYGLGPGPGSIVGARLPRERVTSRPVRSRHKGAPTCARDFASSDRVARVAVGARLPRERVTSRPVPSRHKGAPTCSRDFASSDRVACCGASALAARRVATRPDRSRRQGAPTALSASASPPPRAQPGSRGIPVRARAGSCRSRGPRRGGRRRTARHRRDCRRWRRDRCRWSSARC